MRVLFTKTLFSPSRAVDHTFFKTRRYTFILLLPRVSFSRVPVIEVYYFQIFILSQTDDFAEILYHMCAEGEKKKVITQKNHSGGPTVESLSLITLIQESVDSTCFAVPIHKAIFALHSKKWVRYIDLYVYTRTRIYIFYIDILFHTNNLGIMGNIHLLY